MAAAQTGMKSFYTVLIAVAVAGVGVLAWLMGHRKPVSIPANVVVQPSDTSGFHGYLLGSPTAPLEVTEFADYQCPGCQNYEMVQFPDVQQRLIKPGLVRWRYKDFPLSMHSHSRLAAHAAACAADQDKYWPMHHQIYAGQPEWEQKTSGVDGLFHDYAEQVGLDVDAYDQCMQSGKFAGRIQATYNEAIALGVNVTPTFLIGGRLYPGGLTADELKKMADSAAQAGQ